jgi:hypothetical protein
MIISKKILHKKYGDLIMYEDDEDLELNDVEYFVKEYMDSIELMSKCKKNDINFFLNCRDMHLDDAKSDIHIKHPSKKEIIDSIKKLGFEEDFINVDLDDAVNAIFLHKIDEITIQDSLGDLILGMTPENYMQKLYHYNEFYEDERDVNHYKDARQFGYVVDKMTDTYKILMKYIILNLKGNLATFLEDYYKTKDGLDFVNRANENAVKGNGRITKADFYYFVDQINEASLLEPLITKEDNILIYKMPEHNQLGGFFVTVNDGLKFSLSIMDATDRSGEFSRVFNNTLFSKLIYDGVIKKINRLAKKDNKTIENYWKNNIINNHENKTIFMDSVFTDNHQYFDDVENYYSRSSRPIYFQVNKKYFFLNQAYIDRFSRTLKDINKEKMSVDSTRLKINHVTNLKFLKDLKMTDDIEFQLNQISSNSTYMRAVLRPMYQLNKDLRDFHLNIKEVHYIYNNVIDKRCFNSNIDQNTLNDRNHFNKVMKIIIENFILGNQVEIKKKINCLSKQEVYNILQYLEVFIFRSYLEPVKILSKRLKELSIRVDVKYFVNCIVTNFMESRHEGLTTDINFFLRDLQDKLENYEKFKLLNKRSKLVDILNPLLKDFNAKRKESLEIFNLLDPFLEVGKDLTDRGRELLDLFTKITGELNEMEDIIDKYMPSYDEINEQLARIEKENKKDNEDAE